LLELFSAGLVSTWLKMADLPPALDPWQTAEQVQWQAIPNQKDPAAEEVVQQYLKVLASQGAEESAQGVWLQAGVTPLLNRRGTIPAPAASLTKIATSLASLSTWGMNHQFETAITTAAPIQNGVLQGDLVVQSGGDPSIGWDDAIAMGSALNRMGIKQVTGNLVIVGNFMIDSESDFQKSGEALKKSLNVKTWDEEMRAETSKLPQEIARPNLEIKGSVQRIQNMNGLPQQNILVRHKSLPLTDILKNMNVHSNNDISQMLSDNLGGTQATIRKASEAAGISPDELKLINGSGLGTENQISPHAAYSMFAAIDRYLHPLNLTIGDVFPVSDADLDGTMEDRSMPQGSVIKTGTLSTVSALCGLVPTRDRGLVWFTIINRGTNILELRHQQDLLLQAIQQKWGKPESVAMVQPSAWTKARRERLDATKRNEIVSGG
jgi:serine-type D-Ala-D-Ala carboxypeptidase/endopeptidase (penicillin-binding protein 4)